MPKLRATHVALRAFVAVWVVFLGVLSGCSRSDWLSYRGKQGRGYTTTSIQPPLAVKWELKLRYDGETARSFNPPVILDDTIYFGSSDGNFYALDIESGYMRWVFRTDGPINSVPAANDDYVYFGSNDGRFYCVRRDSGDLVWSYDTGHTVQSTTVLYEDYVAFTSDAGATYLFTPEGMLFHEIPNLVWFYHTFQLYDDVMYFAPGPQSQPNSLGAYDINAHGYLWIINTQADYAQWYSFAALQGRRLYYATMGPPRNGGELNYYALDARTGEIIWQYMDDWILGDRVNVNRYLYFRRNLELLDLEAPSLWRDLVIYTSGDTVVRAFRQSTGQLSWTSVFHYPTSSAPTVAADRVYFGVHGDNLSNDRIAGVPLLQRPRLVCLSARNGKLLWELEIQGSVLSAPVIAGKWIVFGTDENVFYVLEEVL
jgi:outer membrane protein assembly factor BamB